MTSPGLGCNRIIWIFRSPKATEVSVNKAVHFPISVQLENQASVFGTLEASHNSFDSRKPCVVRRLDRLDLLLKRFNLILKGNDAIIVLCNHLVNVIKGLPGVHAKEAEVLGPNNTAVYYSADLQQTSQQRSFNRKGRYYF